MKQERRGASKTQKVGGGILIGVIAVGFLASLYMMSNKRNGYFKLK
jgi:hypothetical protein